LSGTSADAQLLRASASIHQKPALWRVAVVFGAWVAQAHKQLDHGLDDYLVAH
jgi:hypothetical protein